MERDERFLEVINELQITAYTLEKEKGVKNAQAKVSHYKKGVTKSISSDIIVGLCEAYPQVNANYILTGNGSMFKEEDKKELSDPPINLPTSSGISITSEEEYRDAKKKGFHLLPQVSFRFAAGQTQLINTTEDITRYWYLPDCKDCEGIAQIVGRSMSPTLPSGCWVALKKYTLPRENPNMIPFGNIFGIVIEDKDTGEYHGHIKVLRRYKEQSLSCRYWIAHSINSEEFDDFDIEIEQVRSLWIVKQHIVSDALL